ncbi:polysaccharide export protein [Endozoicomonas sp. Mp262]|uniref:polysaccharide biosynthesis/export family protein n=1 Tax=Endozoicomonas sp. Mp262 TaxID=2919499 RepID=UPI0021DB7D76
MHRPYLGNHFIMTHVLSLILLFLPAITQGQTGLTSSRYLLNAGDMISINVFDEEDLSIEARLTDAGTISYPFLGEIQVRGRTVGELEKLIKQGLKGGYLINPRVNVTIKEYRKFFVRGEVNKPGGFSFEPGLTLEKAIALSGGFSKRANKKDVLVTRQGKSGRSEERSITLDGSILPGDIINVKESFF